MDDGFSDFMGLIHTADCANYDLLLANARHNRSNPTEAERELWFFLYRGFEGCKFRRQHIIGNYIVDFVCLKKQLVIELDGEYHFTEEQKEADEIRTKYLNERGFKVIRFTNNEVLMDTNNVLNKIKQQIQ